MSAPLIIAARQSPLAQKQAEIVAAALQQNNISCMIKTFVTEGDNDLTRPLADIGGKELFINHLRRVLQKGEADFAVHSLKDMAATIHPQFKLAAVGFVQDARDVFLSRKYPTPQEMPKNATIGTCSPRRMALLQQYFSHLSPTFMRGNIQTRLAKLRGGDCDGLILAVAGLARMNLLPLSDIYADYLSPTTWIPAPAQGLLAAECLASRTDLFAPLAKISNNAAMYRATAERAFAAAIDGDCHTPLGAHATIEGETIKLHAFFAHNNQFMTTQISESLNNAAKAGQSAATTMLHP